MMFTENFYMFTQLGHEISLWILVFMSVLTLAFVVERYIFLSKVEKTCQDSLYNIQTLLQSGNFDDIDSIDRNKENFVGHAIYYVTSHIKKNGTKGLSELFRIYETLERPHLEKYLNFLATVGSNAPFIGLLGTVFGIMDAFRQLALSGGDPSAVMIGISKALIATAFGLLVAIPAVVFYNTFRKKVQGILKTLEAAQTFVVAHSKVKK